MKFTLEDTNTSQEFLQEQSQAFKAAIHTDDTAALLTLISNGFNLNRMILDDGCEIMPLIYGAQAGSATMVNILILRGAIVNRADDHGLSALDCALWANKDDVVGILLKNGAKCTYNEHQTKNKNSTDEKRPLSYIEKHAARISVQCLRQLVEHTIDRGQQDQHDWNTIAISIKAFDSIDKFSMLFDLILSLKPSRLPYYFKRAIEIDASDVVAFILEKDVMSASDKKIYLSGQGNCNALYIAIDSGSFKTFCALIESGQYSINDITWQEKNTGRISEREYRCITPLFYAVERHRMDIAQYLCTHPDIDINLKGQTSFNKKKSKPNDGYSGYTPLELAQRESPSMYALLLLHDAVHTEMLLPCSRGCSPTVKRTHQSRHQLSEAYDAPSLAEMGQLIMQSYANCPEIIYNRVYSLINQFQHGTVSENLKNKHLRFIHALLSLQVQDKNFKELAQILGDFIYTREDLFTNNRFELSVLFFQHVLDESSACRLFNSSLMQLAGGKSLDAVTPSMALPINELLQDPTLRAHILRGLAKASIYRFAYIDAKPKFSLEDLLMLHTADADPLSLMWDCAQYSLNTNPDLESVDNLDKAIEEITTLFEQIANGQCNDTLLVGGAKQDGEMLRRSMTTIFTAPNLDDNHDKPLNPKDSLQKSLSI